MKYIDIDGKMNALHFADLRAKKSFENCRLIILKLNVFKKTSSKTAHFIKSEPMKTAIDFITKFFLVAALLWFGLMCCLNLIDVGFSWHDLLVEANGMVFDLLVFGVLLSIYEALREKRDKIERLHEEIDDYRGWNEKEATFRIVGAVKRLNKLKISKIDLSFCFLENANLKSANLQGAILTGANLQGAYLEKANLQEADLQMADIQKAKLWETNCRGANFHSANLMASNLSEANFQEAKFISANLMGANLWKANLQKANFNHGKLNSAIFRNANLQNAILTNVKVEDIDLEEADLQGANVSVNWFGLMEHMRALGGEEIIKLYDMDIERKVGVLRLK